MAEKLIAPRTGEGVEELFVVNWIKQEGDQVEEMEALVEVETDKVVTELPSPAAGTLLKILAPQDQPVKVGEVMAWIGKPGEALEEESAPVQETANLPAEAEPEAPPPAALESAPADEGSSRSSYISPLVRKIAQEHQVDLALVSGTGLDGRITKNDILTYIENRPARPTSPAPKPQLAPTQAAPSAEPAPMPTGPGKLIPHTSVRKRIAERMVQSKQAAPHVLTVMEADLSAVLAHRKAHKAQFAEKGVNLTLTAYFIAAIVKALQAYPMANSTWTDEGIFVHDTLNIGMAVALGKDGLIVPVIKQAEGLSLLGIAKQVNDLAERARAKKLQPDEVKDGTFTLTNHGTGKSLFASPVIFQPQAGILGTGVMQKRAVVVSDVQGNDAIAIRPMIYLSYVFDHRILDGEAADDFLYKVKQALDSWPQEAQS